MSELVIRRPEGRDEFVAWWRQMRRGFYVPPQHPDDARFASALDPERLRLVLTPAGEVVGTVGAIALQIAVGDQRVGFSGSGLGTMRADLTGGGTFGRLIRAVDDDAREAGEPFMATWTPHGGLFGRFGWGPAFATSDLSIASRDLATVQGDRSLVRTVDRPEALALLPTIHESVMAARRAGVLRSRVLWDGWLDVDPDEDWQGPWSATQVAVVGDEGYAAYRVHAGDGWRPDGTVDVTELVARTPEAHAALWSHVAAIDTATTVTATYRPVDDPLPHLLANRFALTVTQGEPCWLRLVDLPAAWRLGGARGPGEVRVQVHDPMSEANSGTWRLAVTDDRPEVDRVDGPADLELRADALATAFFGTVGLASLAAAGRVTVHRPEALVTLSRMLVGETTPWASFVF